MRISTCDIDAYMCMRVYVACRYRSMSHLYVDIRIYAHAYMYMRVNLRHTCHESWYADTQRHTETLQHTAIHCNAKQQAATRCNRDCNTLQHAATRRNKDCNTPTINHGTGHVRVRDEINEVTPIYTFIHKFMNMQHTSH